MSNRYNRPVLSRARQRSISRKRLLIACGALAALVVIVALVLLLPKGDRDRTVETLAKRTPTPTPDGPLIAEGEPLVPLNSPTPSPAPSPTPSPEADAADPQKVASRPTPVADGFLPIFLKANTQEKIIAITVDDCFQAENLQQIVDKAIETGAKLTIFPIGRNAIKDQQSQTLKYAWENGFELENHTFTHNGLYCCSNEELADEVYMQQVALSSVLGVEYQCHFLRPMGGDARGDQRLHAYARQMGYYGIAHWSASGSANNSKIAKALEPGAIYLFHTTDKDREKLLKFIPWVAEQGYQMVTLNEMFGYPANETSALTEPIEGRTSPPLEPYDMVYVPLKNASYCWEAYLLQEKLIELGYLTGEPDGIYKDGCEAAVKAYQKDHGLEETGVADADLVRELLEGV